MSKTQLIADLARTKILFMNRVQKTTTCWMWKGSINKLRGGYGYIKVKQVMYRAHRLAWLLFRGKIQSDLSVCHRCNIPSCVNPRHLYLGSHEENIQFAVANNRMASGKNHGLQKHPEARAYGERNGMSKLTTRQRGFIRKRANSGESISNLAKEFHVSYNCIARLIKNETYPH